MAEATRSAALEPVGKTQITVLLGQDVLDALRKHAKDADRGYQTAISQALREYLAEDGLEDGTMPCTLTLDYWLDDGWYVGKLREMPNVFSQGENMAELEANIQDVYRLMAEDAPCFASAVSIDRSAGEHGLIVAGDGTA